MKVIFPPVLLFFAFLFTLELEIRGLYARNNTYFISIDTQINPYLDNSVHGLLKPNLYKNTDGGNKRLVEFDESGSARLASVERAPTLDDKQGLIDENLFRESNHNPNFPTFCSEDVPCQTVNSQVQPPLSPSATNMRFRRGIPENKYWNGSDCEHEARVSAFGGKYTLCLFLQRFGDDPIITSSKLDYSKINVTVFSSGNETMDIPLHSFDLKFATGFVKGEPFTSVSGFIMDNHFYGTVIMRDTVHYLEPHRRKSRDMHILGNGRKTLLHR
ncbi:uncharacterized protein [Lepeophtheirus salmonis]|uniref:uncharacterized protein n=1 Tax=Lepeophtheirus salmonis TaxID=72036 RepID=UPI003AF39DFE